jgi:methylglutaconyl-CoA hydratase
MSNKEPGPDPAGCEESGVNPFRTIRVSRSRSVATVALNRPEVRNAFDDVMIGELDCAFARLSAARDVRVVVLRGEGSVFCAGADVAWMRKAAGYSYEDNVRDAERMARMLRVIDTCRQPVIARVQGAAIGGGIGLAAVCDIAIASEEAKFSLAEVKLGILPAAISPFVLRAIGPRAAREYFLTGDRFDALEARRIGLIHQVAPAAALDEAVERRVDALLSSGPEAVRAAKELIDRVSRMTVEEAFGHTARAIAERRASNEGREGLAAFLEKRPPAWVPRKAK